MWTFYYFVRELLSNLRSNPLISLAALSTVLVLILILGLFSIILINLEHMTAQMVGDLRVVAYLRDDLRASKIAGVKQKLMSLPHVQSATVVDKEAALQRLLTRLNGKVEAGDLTRNPLPDSIELKVDDARQMAAVAQGAEALTEVQKVKFGDGVAHRMLAFTRVLRWTGGTVLGVLFVSTVLVISNTIRLAVYARRREIEIMQMVGAARWFVQIPFILEGMVLGFLGAGMACLLLSTSYQLLVPQLTAMVPFLPVLAPTQLLPLLAPVLLALGVLVGSLGSWISINRYLKV